MKRSVSLILIALTTLCFSALTLAGNNAPKGPHYNLNIIGVEKGKKADMTGSNRHTIFVPLVTSSNGKKATNVDVEIETQIWLAPGDDFRVCDGNGFDFAYGCADNPFWDDYWNVPIALCETSPGKWEECAIVNERKQGAVFELPCNSNIPDDQELFFGCDLDLPFASYEVWARALGSPKGDPSVTITTCATVQDELQCSTENAVKTRTKGKTPFTEVTNELTSMVVDYCVAWEGDVCVDYDTARIALFADVAEDWFWNYANRGVRLLQLRFYDYVAD